MKFALKTKIYLLIVGTVAGIALLILYALTALSTHEIVQAVHSDVQATQGMLTASMSERNRALRNQCLLLVHQPGPRYLVNTDWKTVSRTAAEYAKQMGADRVLMTDRDGQVMGDSGLSTPLITDRSHDAGIAAAMQGQVWSGVVIQDEKLLLVVSAPVLDPVSKVVIETLCAYSVLDGAVTQDLKQALGQDVAFVQNGHVLASSLPLPADIPVPEKTPSLVSLEGKSYYALYASLPDTTPSDQIGFVVLHSYRQATTLYVQLRLAAFFACLLALLGAIFIARALINPLGSLVDVARRLTQGEWPSAFAVRRKDEIGVLQSTFNQMISSLKANEEHLRSLIDIDQLTGLPNHRALVTALDQELERSRRFDRPCTLLFLDLDHFKALNDGFGHLAGDTALREFAQVIRENLRPMDTAGRWGGEEFVILLPETDSEVALTVAERIRAVVSGYLFSANGGIHLTCSMGLASYPQDAQDRPALVEAADQAMYAAKHLGRNQVRAISDPVLALLDNETVTSREEVALQGIVEAFVILVGTRDLHIGIRMNYVAGLALRIAQRLGLDSVQTRLVELVSKLYEIGKAAIPDAILHKSGPMTAEELKLMRMHPIIGADVVGRIPALRLAVPGIRAHHEQWDGRGYPDGIAGEAIPLAARIVAVADSFMTLRLDQNELTPQEVFNEIRRHAGTKYDPKVVAALERELDSLPALDTLAA